MSKKNNKETISTAGIVHVDPEAVAEEIVEQEETAILTTAESIVPEKKIIKERVGVRMK
jgi:hypothetical protein